MAKVAAALKPKPKQRACFKCGGTYQRRNKIEAWITQNPGHRLGWVKREVKICVRCGPAPLAARVFMVLAPVRSARR